MHCTQYRERRRIDLRRTDGAPEAGHPYLARFRAVARVAQSPVSNRVDHRDVVPCAVTEKRERNKGQK